MSLMTDSEASSITKPTSSAVAVATWILKDVS
jgi:hypothetical protein